MWKYFLGIATLLGQLNAINAMEKNAEFSLKTLNHTIQKVIKVTDTGCIFSKNGQPVEFLDSLQLFSGADIETLKESIKNLDPAGEALCYFYATLKHHLLKEIEKTTSDALAQYKELLCYLGILQKRTGGKFIKDPSGFIGGRTSDPDPDPESEKATTILMNLITKEVVSEFGKFIKIPEQAHWIYFKPKVYTLSNMQQIQFLKGYCQVTGTPFNLCTKVAQQTDKEGAIWGVQQEVWTLKIQDEKVSFSNDFKDAELLLPTINIEMLLPLKDFDQSTINLWGLKEKDDQKFLELFWQNLKSEPFEAILHLAAVADHFDLALNKKEVKLSFDKFLKADSSYTSYYQVASHSCKDLVSDRVYSIKGYNLNPVISLSHSNFASKMQLLENGKMFKGSLFKEGEQ